MLNARFSDRVSLSSSVFPACVVDTAWVTLLDAVDLVIALAATSIGRIGLERRGLGRAATSALGLGIVKRNAAWLIGMRAADAMRGFRSCNFCNRIIPYENIRAYSGQPYLVPLV